MLAGVPAHRGSIAAVNRQHPLTAQSHLVDDLTHLTSRSSLEGFVADQVSGNQPRVVVTDGDEISRTQVPLVEAVFPRQPLRREQCTVTGQEHHLVDGRDTLPRRAGQRDRPPPSGITGLSGVEEVADDPIGFGNDASMVTDTVAAHSVIQAGSGGIDSLGENLVKLGSASWGGHRTIVADDRPRW